MGGYALRPDGFNVLRYWTPGFSPKRLWKRLSQKKHMLTTRLWTSTFLFYPKAFWILPRAGAVCISTLLYECCFCYTHHFGAIGYTRWHRDQLDRGRVYQLLVKTSTLRLAHMMYPCLPWFNNNTLGVPELGRPPVIHVISIWFSDPWNKPSSYWGTPRFYRFWVPVSGQPPAGTSCCKEAMLPHHHHHHDRCTVTVYKHL